MGGGSSGCELGGICERYDAGGRSERYCLDG